jgi:hypothetical protein
MRQPSMVCDMCVWDNNVKGGRFEVEFCLQLCECFWGSNLKNLLSLGSTVLFAASAELMIVRHEFDLTPQFR